MAEAQKAVPVVVQEVRGLRADYGSRAVRSRCNPCQEDTLRTVRHHRHRHKDRHLSAGMCPNSGGGKWRIDGMPAQDQ